MSLRSHSSAVIAESPPEQVSTARPRLGRRAPGTAKAFASSSSSWKSEAQAPPASSTSARKMRWSPASAPVCAAAAADPAGGAAHLEHRDADVVLGAAGERLAQVRAVAVGLEVERDRADAGVGRQLGDPGRRVERHRIAARDDRVQAQPAARGEGVDGEVAALRDDRNAPGLERRERVAPQRGARMQGDDPVAVGPADRQLVRRRHRRELGLEPRARLDLAEARPEHDGPAAAERARPPSTTSMTPAAGIATTTASGGDGHAASDGKQGRPCTEVAARVYAPDLAAEAGELEVEQRLAAVRAGALGRTDDRDRARVE